MVLHAQPALYTLDGLTGVKKPLGLHADRLGVHIHVVAADGSPVRNLDLCVRSAHLEVKSIIAAPVATGLACLSARRSANWASRWSRWARASPTCRCSRAGCWSG